MLRRQCVVVQRAYQRAGRRALVVDQSVGEGVFKRARKILSMVIKRPQERCWTEICTQMEQNPWGLPYRVVVKALGRANPGSASPG